jgi:hypothetical protein
MKPTAQAPAIDGAVDGLVDSEPDTHLDTDVDRPVEADPTLVDPVPTGVPTPRTEAVPLATEPTAPGVRAPAEPALADREREILAFERRWWKHAGAKEQAIRDTFDISATRYYQLLNGLLDNPAALVAEPMLVGRLRRLRSSRARSRRR